jgi:L-xylulokinase
LPWIKYNEPDVYRRIDKIFLVKDYVKFRLTGERTSDFTDMSGTCLLDNPRKQYARELLDMYDIPEMWDALPRLAESFEVVGRVTKAAAEATGLAEGTPVVGGLYDVDAGALGSGVIAPGTLCIIAGTWSINEVIIEQPVENPALAMVHVAMVPNRWMVLEGSATSMANLEWFANTLCGEEKQLAAQRGVSVYEICNEMVDSLPPGSTDIIFHPFLFGSNVQATARAGFYGVAGWHTKAHLVRALYEGVVYGHRNHIDRLRILGPLKVARITGGGSRSQVWTQIFADTLDMTMEVAEGVEVSAKGVAMSAGIGVGLYKDHADAVAKAVRIVRRQEPIAENTPLYDARYKAYRELLDVMQKPWDTLYGLGEAK